MTIPLFVVYLRPALTLQTSLVEIRWVTSRGRCLLKLNILLSCRAMHHIFLTRFSLQIAAVGIIARTAAAGACVAAPLIGFQYYGWLQHCTLESVAGGGQLPPWCLRRVPYLYGYVQSHYWGVGFLKYWVPQQVRAIPRVHLISRVGIGLPLLIAFRIHWCG